jgi:predicted HTH domain antitoxin
MFLACSVSMRRLSIVRDPGEVFWYDRIMNQTPPVETAGITLTVPAHLAETVRSALEGVALAAYRSGTLSLHQVQNLLGFRDRWQTQEWLGTRGISQSYSVDDLHADRATLDQIVGK